MSNQLKTLSRSQLEYLISEKISEYIGEKCLCTIEDMSTPNIDSEANIALHDKRDITFNVHLSYNESKPT